MSDKAETGCWLVELWRKRRTTSSIISPFRCEEEALDYLKHSDRGGATHLAECIEDVSHEASIEFAVDIDV